MVTLKDVAKLAGVSTATVSYCLTGSKGVKPETRMRVMQAIEELNYIPNHAARNLREPDNREIGIVLPDIEDPYYSEILKGIVYEAENEGYSLNIAFSYWLANQESRIIQDFISRNVSGLIILTCQSANTEFFMNTLVRNNLPNVFIDRIPRGMNVNFQTFDNYTTMHYLTEQLIKKGYRKIGLMIGPEEHIAESDSLFGFTDAHIEQQLEYDQNLIYYCNMTKEDSFSVFMNALKAGRIPQALITSSENIMKGVVEALDLMHIRIPEDICLITLGIECWNDSNYHSKVLHTSRQAYTMGRHCCRLLIRNINEPGLFETEFMLHQDRNLEETSVNIPDPPALFSFAHCSRTLRILSQDLPTVRAVSTLAREFSNHYDAEVEVDYLPIRELFHTIVSDSKKAKSEYDLYVVDVSWMRFMAEEGCLMDISGLIKSIGTSHFMPQNLANCCVDGRYYGLPVVGGTHLLFYRKDYFTNSSLQKEFKNMHRISLRPPKTWTEFNGIARFFTREFTPGSPSLYGTALPAQVSEELVLDILIRLWSYGGGLYDQNNRLVLDTPQNERAFQNILETCSYIPPDSMELNHEQAFQEFAEGKIAMLISYTEYASAIRDYIPSDLMPNVGFCHVPGNTPSNVGWQLGVSKTTENLGLIGDFFRWLCRKNISNYLTIMDGNAVMKYPHQNHDILKIYPWLELTEEGLGNCRSRIYPVRGRKGNIPAYQVENVLRNVFHKIWRDGMDIRQALKEGEQEMYRLFT